MRIFLAGNNCAAATSFLYCIASRHVSFSKKFNKGKVQNFEIPTFVLCEHYPHYLDNHTRLILLAF